MSNSEYKEKLIEDILKNQMSGWFTREKLEKKPVHILWLICNSLGTYSAQ